MTKDTRGGKRIRIAVNHKGVEYLSAKDCPVYNKWNGMMYRCLNEKSPSFLHYGGRGIRVAPELQTLQGFLDVVGLPPTPQHQLDRINNDGHYEPGNLRWATPSENLRNQRRSRLLTHNGKTQAISAWAEELGVSVQVLWTRLEKYKWTLEATLETPKGAGGRRFGKRSP